MPTISRFYGITVTMYHAEHGVPHFHARHGGETAVIRIDDLAVLRGTLPPRAMVRVKRWAALNRAALLQNWLAAQRSELLTDIAPLS